ncbi:nSTAND3 domain-containing NTPase [Streptomyces sp. NPDC001920]
MTDPHHRAVPGRIRQQAQRLLRRVPGIDRPGLRQALLQDAAFDTDLLDSIPVDGSTIEFCAVVVDRCARHHHPPGTEPPLVSVLRAATELVGSPLDSELLTLARQITAIAASDASEDRTLDDFLDELGLDRHAEASPYAQLTSVFVPPQQYDDIVAILERHHVVFIVGDPHVGKTFTAVELLWRLYSRSGFSPSWVNSQQLSLTLSTAPGRFEDRLAKLFPNDHAIYLEDPFGATVPVDMPEFVTNLRRFLDLVAARRCRIVITSRSAVFDKVIIDSFAEYTITLSQRLAVETAYTTDQLKMIAERYVACYRPRWTPVSPSVITRITDALPVPHNVELFIRNTRDIPDVEEALTRLPGYRDISSEFGRQVRLLPLVEQAFLYLVATLSSEHVDRETVRRLFDAAVRDGDLGPVGITSFDMALDAVSDYILWHGTLTGGYLALRHPSIEEGLDRCVRADPQLTEVVRRLVRRMADSASVGVRSSALQGFLRHADIMWTAPWGQRIFREFLDASDVAIRQAARNRLISDFKKVPAPARVPLLEYIEATWNERYLLRLVLIAPVAEPWRERILGRLLVTWDDWVRFRVARNLAHLFKDPANDPAVRRLLTDPTRQIARAAGVELVNVLARRPTARDWQAIRLLRDTGLATTSPEIAHQIDALLNAARATSSEIPADLLPLLLPHPPDPGHPTTQAPSGPRPA